MKLSDGSPADGSPEEGSPDKIKYLTRQLKGMKRVALAFSGGVDSTFLLAVAKQAGLEKLLAITVSSQFFTRAEKEFTAKLTDSMGVAHICLELDILGETRVVENTPQRCYFCKTRVFSLVRETAIEKATKAALADAEFLISERFGMIDAEIIKGAKSLKLIQRLGSQVHDIDLETASRAGIKVCYQPIGGVIRVAEHLIMQMLAVGKKLREVEEVALAADLI